MSHEVKRQHLGHVSALLKEGLLSREDLETLFSPFLPSLLMMLAEEGDNGGILYLLATLLKLDDSETKLLTNLVEDEGCTFGFFPFSCLAMSKDLPVQVRESFFSATQEANHNLKSGFSTKKDFAQVKKTLRQAISELSAKPANEKAASEKSQTDRTIRSQLLSHSTNQELDSYKGSLIMTNTARENIIKICEVAQDPIPLLLEGNF